MRASPASAEGSPTFAPRSGEDLAGLKAEIAALGPWHHDVEVAPGVWTAAVVPPSPYPDHFGEVSVLRPFEVLPHYLGAVYPNGLEGRSFLDCACNAGGYLFAARSLGAGPCFGFDVRDHWIRQARLLASHLPSERIEVEQLSLEALPAKGLPRFDVTLFSGILYHLPDPVAGLRIAADLTGELIIVSTAMKAGGGDALNLIQESDTEVMSGVDRLAWLPGSPRVVAAMLAWCGFPHLRILHQSRPERDGRCRLTALAARDAATFRHFDAADRPMAAGIRGRLARFGIGRRRGSTSS